MSVTEGVSAVKIVGQTGLFGTGITLGNALIGVLNLICGGALVAFIRTRPKILEIGNLRRKDESDLTSKRIATLEGKIETEQAGREAERIRHKAEVAILRHSVANSNTCLDAILLLLEAAPEKAAEHAAKMRKIREDMRDREERGKSSFAAAKIAGTAKPLKERDEPRRPLGMPTAGL